MVNRAVRRTGYSWTRSVRSAAGLANSVDSFRPCTLTRPTGPAGPVFFFVMPWRFFIAGFAVIVSSGVVFGRRAGSAEKRTGRLSEGDGGGRERTRRRGDGQRAPERRDEAAHGRCWWYVHEFNGLRLFCSISQQSQASVGGVAGRRSHFLGEKWKNATCNIQKVELPTCLRA